MLIETLLYTVLYTLSFIGKWIVLIYPGLSIIWFRLVPLHEWTLLEVLGMVIFWPVSIPLILIDREFSLPVSSRDSLSLEFSIGYSFDHVSNRAEVVRRKSSWKEPAERIDSPPRYTRRYPRHPGFTRHTDFSEFDGIIEAPLELPYDISSQTRP